MRDASTVTPPSSISRQVPKPKPAWLTSSPVTGASTSLARGPHSPIVVQAEVRSAIEARPSGGRWPASHLASIIPVAPPVTTRNRRGPSRMIVRSARKPPSASSSDVYTTRPTLTSIWATAADCTTSSAPGPVTSRTANADRSTSPQASRMARCSALMTGDHQRASHSAVRSISRPSYRPSSSSLQAYQFGRSQPAVSMNTAPSARSRSCMGGSRTPRCDSHCSAGCTIPYILLNPSRARAVTSAVVRWCG